MSFPFPRPFTGPAYFGDSSSVALLLGNSETAGLAIDFTASSNRLLIRNNNLPLYKGNAFNNDGGPVSFSRASLGTVVDADGKIKWAAHNLLLASEQFDSASWNKSFGGTGVAGVVTPNAAVAPNGTQTADRIDLNRGAGNTLSDRSFVAQSLTSGDSVQVTGGIYLKAATLSDVGKTVAIRTASTSAYAEVALTSDWVLYSNTGVTASRTMEIESRGTLSASNSVSLLVWGAHLYRSDLGGMQANASAYPMYNPTTPRNLLGYTESFDNAAWTKTDTTITADNAAAPNGLTTADLVTEGSAGTAQISCGVTVSSGAVASVSFHLKRGNTDWIRLVVSNSTSQFRAWYNLSTGAVGTSSATVNGSVISASIVNAGNGWYRVSLIGSISGVTTYNVVINTAASDGSGSRVSGGTYYLWGAQLSDSASLDPYVPNHFAAPSAAAYHGPRLDYDPVTLAPKGLLVEEQRSNVLLNSASLSTQSVTVSATAYTLSFYGTGTVTLSGTSTAGPLVGTGASNRVTLTFTPTAGTLTLTVSGTVTQAQLEAGSFATSYIPTTSASVTRSADVAQIGTAAFPYSAAQSSIVASVDLIGYPNNVTHAILTIGSSSQNYFGVSTYSSTGLQANASVRYSSRVSGTFDADASVFSAPNLNTAYKIAGAFKQDDFAACVNGGTVGTDTLGNLPSGVTQMGIGQTVSANTFNGHIRQLTYIPRRLTNAELQQRTA